ncbi:Hypothetical predicted protein [Paramuricea clavata]|uniref:Uncharacterized protein n=1 Tax=Paramuricea clavata TaxID=317549 RepID=A0A7D9HY23_PARCT|nr:Hypothetical predicted protein [Paramuricea clavata]
MVLLSHDKMEEQLDKLAESSNVNATTYQGTSDFLEKYHNAIDGANSDQIEDILCNKDTGGKTTLHSWSRGSMWIVTAGGIIEYFQPLYRSESPTQAFLIFMSWLLLKFKPMIENGLDNEEVTKAIESTILSYDNMCHVDNMKICSQDLPLPAPLNLSWKLLGKVIDRLHLRNHKDPKCKKYYDPDGKVPKELRGEFFLCRVSCDCSWLGGRWIIQSKR